jgi:hypothetical protein
VDGGTRANGQTRVRLEGSDEWKPLSEWPEFSGAFATSARSAPPPPLPMSGGSSSLRPGEKTSGMAIASLVLGSSVSRVADRPGRPGAGHHGASEDQPKRREAKGHRLAIAGIILSGLMMLIGLPHQRASCYRRWPKASNERSSSAA